MGSPYEVPTDPAKASALVFGGLASVVGGARPATLPGDEVLVLHCGGRGEVAQWLGHV